MESLGSGPDGRYVNQDGERPALVKQMDDRLVASGMGRQEAEREVDRIGADVFNRGFGNQAALGSLSSGAIAALTNRKRKRVSRVVRIGEWPSKVRKRNLGFLHDQVWFYDDLPCHRDQLRDTDKKLWVPAGIGLSPTYQAPDGSLWIHEPARKDWLRLYLDRRMFFHPLGTLRYHVFHSGDDDSAPHDHQWWFITFPLRSYEEKVLLDWEDRRRKDHPHFTIMRIVRAFRFHFRRAGFAHIVQQPARPVPTLVITGRKKRVWGFWPAPDTFVPNDVWTQYD